MPLCKGTYVSKGKAALISCETLDVYNAISYNDMPASAECVNLQGRVLLFFAQTFVLCMFCLTEHLEIIQKGWTAEFGYIQWCSTDIRNYV